MRPAFTLVELVLVLAVLGICLLVAALDAPGFLPRKPATADIISGLRQAAVAAGHDTTVLVLQDGRPLLVTARPDGSVLRDSVLSSRAFRGEP